MIVQRRPAPVMGSWWAAVADAAKEMFSAKGGQVITVPAASTPLSMTTVGVLAGAVVLAMVMKRKKII